MVTRPEHALHAHPNHTLAEYLEAWGRAGDLELAPDNAPQSEQVRVLDRLSRPSGAWLAYATPAELKAMAERKPRK
jgi:hypothetical protein